MEGTLVEFTNLSGGITITSLLQNNQHPLQNGLVISNISKYLSAEDLKSLRRVSKVWNNAMIPELKIRHARIKFSRIDKLTSYLDLMIKSESVPFTRFGLYALCFNEEPVQTFFRTYSHTITSLKITMEKNSDLSFSHFRTYIIGLCSNLKDFEFLDVRDSHKGDDFEEPEINFDGFWKKGKIFSEEFPTRELLNLKKLKLGLAGLYDNESQPFLNDLIVNVAVNLEYLDLIYLSEEEHYILNSNPYHDYDWNTAVALNKTHGQAKLTVLKLKEAYYKVLDTLVKLASRVELKEFHISGLGYGNHGHGHDKSATLIERFLSLQANSLRFLFLDVGIFANRFHLSFKMPLMYQLEELTIEDGWNGSGYEIEPFVNNFRNLKKLNYYNTWFWEQVSQEEKSLALGKWRNPTNNSVPHRSLEELKFSYIHRVGQLLHLAITFPYLVKLQTQLDDISFLTHIWDKWPKLESFHVKAKRCKEFRNDSKHEQLDEIITGIPRERSKVLKLFIGKAPCAQLQDLKTKPGISDMKSLKDIKLELGASITDISIYYGLVPLNTKFKSLYIKDTEQVSVAGQEVLKQMLVD